MPPAPKPAPPPAAQPVPVEPLPTPLEQAPPLPAILPAATPPVEPIPPGGTAQAPSTAKREEKARKHASQSAFVIRPAGVTGEEWFAGGEQWFYAGVGFVTLLTLLLSAKGMRAGPRPRPALLFNSTRGGAKRPRRPR